MAQPDTGDIVMHHLFGLFVQGFAGGIIGGNCGFLQQFSQFSVLVPALAFDGFGAGAEEVAGEVVGIAVVAAPAEEVQANQEAIAAGTEVCRPVALKVELDIEAGGHQVSGSSFANFLGGGEVEAGHGHVVEAQRNDIAGFIDHIAIGIHDVFSNGDFAQAIRETGFSQQLA